MAYFFVSYVCDDLEPGLRNEALLIPRALQQGEPLRERTSPAIESVTDSWQLKGENSVLIDSELNAA